MSVPTVVGVNTALTPVLDQLITEPLSRPLTLSAYRLTVLVVDRPRCRIQRYPASMKAPLFDWLRSLLSRQKETVAEVEPRFPAVEIDLGLNECCAVVRRLRGRRFLMTNAPPIPLPGCTMKKCECRYARYSDRRQETRRGGDFGILNPLFTSDDKREKSGGRRVGDLRADVDGGEEDCG